MSSPFVSLFDSYTVFAGRKTDYASTTYSCEVLAVGLAFHHCNSSVIGAWPMCRIVVGITHFCNQWSMAFIVCTSNINSISRPRGL